ncbi:ABC-2 type transport system ATP-binding protein [Streptomyces sp. LamerLS-316]|uniref:ABC transporter ATP-binding protein n=1 Tax=unclassified Streptomyces TaxID=2593676 RepID=UPI000823AF11|nr:MULTISPECIES: ATP-binding cassette domain-containing protein [unclassified Streptomyces]MYQ42608.1 ATP-binding cassette domain-containing protein [Streptomyces sp. SID4921]SCK31808.1 ABC-2 type transport system ATP-binding protein [Streptomyces sp. LamerLS-316]
MSITFTDCSYRYKRRSRPVLTGFSYELRDGLTVLLGPNGAGKSTLLRLGASVARPETGRITCGTVPSTSREYRRQVSWMPQQITAMAGLTAREQVAYSGWLKGMGKSDAWDRALDALTRVGLRDRADDRARILSGGQLRRLGLASALVHDCRVLLLDEPTAGMDPTQRRVFRDLLTAAVDGGGLSVLMSTHDVADLADDADRITVLAEGRIRFDGTTGGFLGHAPADAPASRHAEAAYTALTLRD